MTEERGKSKKIALLQISIKNIPFLEENLSSPEIIDLINKIYTKVKTIIKTKEAYLYKFTGSNFFIIFNDMHDNKNLKKAFNTTKEIFEKLKKHNDFLNMNHIPKLDYSYVLDYGDVSVGKVKYEDIEKTILVGTPFRVTNRATILNERRNITPILITENVYQEIKTILSEYLITVMGSIKLYQEDIYLYGSYQFNK